MDVKSDHAGMGPDTAATAVVHLPVATPNASAGGQGQLFGDANLTFADTDRIPVVGSERRTPGRGPSGWLRAAVIVVGLAVLAAGAVLVLAQTGVIGKDDTIATNGTPHNAAGSSNGREKGSSGHASTHQHQNASGALVTKVAMGPSNAEYTIGAGLYQVTVTTTSGPCWVSVGSPGHAASFAGIIPAASSHTESILGASTVELGAGGTSVTLTAGHRSETLTPLAAPFTYDFVNRS